MPDTVSLATVARICGEPEQTFKRWRHEGVGELGNLGKRVGRDLELDDNDALAFALTSAFYSRQRDAAEAWRAAEKWFYLAAIGELDFASEVVYSLEVETLTNKTERYYIEGAEALKEAVFKHQLARSVSILNITDIIFQVRVGCDIALRGVEEARERMERSIVGDDPEWRAKRLAWFDEIAHRVSPPKRPRAKRRANQAQSMTGGLIRPGSPS